ncbi:MAG: glycosyltransferase family 2 protein [candidate division KSB1 bacterium]|nr:glycosyltransferase family 2 protein [candidate division KSB1 bacterium]
MTSSGRSVPLVSVGMPVFNGERYVAEAIESILNQTFPDFELIVSDNASTDRTAEICQAYAQRDARIRLYRSDKNRGAAWNFNRVFWLARGRYFKWASSDDLCHPEYLASCLPILEADPGVVLCYGRTQIIDEQGRFVQDYSDNLHLDQDSPAERFSSFLRQVGLCNPVFGVIRAKALAQTRLLGAFPGSDTCLLAHLALLGKFVQVPKVLFYRRFHSEASSAKKDLQNQMAFFDPRREVKVAMPALRRWLEFVRVVGQSGLPAGERLRIYLRLARTFFWWRDVFGQEFRAAVAAAAQA